MVYCLAPSVQAQDFQALRWAPLSSFPPSRGTGVREPNFIRQLTQWCDVQPLAKGLDPKVERRECYRAGILFCRRHHRMDSFCLLVFVQHYLSAKLLIAFDGKIGLKSGVPLLTLLYPDEGAEVMSDGGIPVMVRRVLDPDVRGQLRIIIQRNAELIELLGQPPGESPATYGLVKDAAVLHLHANDTGPWVMRGLVHNDTSGEWVHETPWVLMHRLTLETCTPRPEWEQIRVYDVFLFNGEADLLEIRLHELHDVVHSFVIIEFDTTFRGRRKEYCLERLMNDPEQRKRFEPFLGQIVYLKYSLAEEVGGPWGGQQLPSDKFDPWSLEYLQRDSFTKALAVAGARLSDVVLLLDADELVRREAVMAIKKCHAVHMPADLHLDYYMYYNFHWRKRGLSFHAIACYASLLALVPAPIIEQLVGGRAEDRDKAKVLVQVEPFYPVPDAGWHLSYFMSPEEVCAKLGQFAHSEYDLPPFNTPHDIARRMQQGVDLFDRPEPHDFLGPDQVLPLLPRHVHHNMHRFAHLLPHMPQLQPLQEGGRGNSTSGNSSSSCGSDWSYVWPPAERREAQQEAAAQQQQQQREDRAAARRQPGLPELHPRIILPT